MVIRQTDSGSPAMEGNAEDAADGNADGTAEGNAESSADSIPESLAEAPEEGSRGYATAMRSEQEYVSMLYGLLDRARERSRQELASVRARGGPGGTHQARLERDIS